MPDDVEKARSAVKNDHDGPSCPSLSITRGGCRRGDLRGWMTFPLK
jgi:hypothetical protein